MNTTQTLTLPERIALAVAERDAANVELARAEEADRRERIDKMLREKLALYGLADFEVSPDGTATIDGLTFHVAERSTSLGGRYELEIGRPCLNGCGQPAYQGVYEGLGWISEAGRLVHLAEALKVAPPECYECYSEREGYGDEYEAAVAPIATPTEPLEPLAELAAQAKRLADGFESYLYHQFDKPRPATYADGDDE